MKGFVRVFRTDFMASTCWSEINDFSNNTCETHTHTPIWGTRNATHHVSNCWMAPGGTWDLVHMFSASIFIITPWCSLTHPQVETLKSLDVIVSSRIVASHLVGRNTTYIIPSHLANLLLNLSMWVLVAGPWAAVGQNLFLTSHETVCRFHGKWSERASLCHSGSGAVVCRNAQSYDYVCGSIKKEVSSNLFTRCLKHRFKNIERYIYIPTIIICVYIRKRTHSTAATRECKLPCLNKLQDLARVFPGGGSWYDLTWLHSTIWVDEIKGDIHYP